MRAAGSRLLPPVASPEGVAALSLATLVAGAALSGEATLSALLVATGLALGVRPVLVHRRDAVVKLAAAAAVGWLAYGALIGSLPAWSDPGDVTRWATTEGRVLVSLAAMMIASAVRSGAALRWLLASTSALVTVLHALALAVYAAGRSPLGFPIQWRGLFFGFSSSHHVVAFLSATVALVALATRGLMSAWMRWIVLIVALSSILAAGSRTALLGLLAGAVVIAWERLDRRRLWQVAAIGIVLLSAAVASNDRFRTTTGALVDPDFLSAAAESFTTAEQAVARERAGSEAEANVLLRLAYWGEAVQHIGDSPLIGMGAFRQNDSEVTFAGVRGLVYVATGGDTVFDDSEPHNVILYLLLEVGAAGLALFAAPYVIAWRRTTRRSGPPGARSGARRTTGDGLDPESCIVLTRSTIVAATAMSMVSAGVLATGLGITANSVIFAGAAVLAVGELGGTRAPLTQPAKVSTLPPLGIGYRVFSRTLDMVVGALALAITLPLMAVLAVMVKATSPGPALYLQTRVGRNGQLFEVVKFRTMREGAHAELLADPVARAAYVQNGYKLDENDGRITRIGRWLRKYSLDELPQFVNVLAGQMSIVGVRPLVPDEFWERSDADRELYVRMRPGMTGLWQVEGRSALIPADRLALDHEYLSRPSVARDIAILARTPAALVRTSEAK